MNQKIPTSLREAQEMAKSVDESWVVVGRPEFQHPSRSTTPRVEPKARVVNMGDSQLCRG